MKSLVPNHFFNSVRNDSFQPLSLLLLNRKTTFHQTDTLQCSPTSTETESNLKITERNTIDMIIFPEPTNKWRKQSSQNTKILSKPWTMKIILVYRCRGIHHRFKEESLKREMKNFLSSKSNNIEIEQNSYNYFFNLDKIQKLAKQYNLQKKQELSNLKMLHLTNRMRNSQRMSSRQSYLKTRMKTNNCQKRKNLTFYKNNRVIFKTYEDYLIY